ncbi:hypothetical protein IIA95_04265 [Patescibacteria group bacterium]|nr:hypothetical protein [Patescibacteria group bacterium]
MLGRVIEFIKYHNAFSIGFALLFLGFGGALAANQELKEGIVNTIVSAEEIIKTVDNSLIVSIDLNHYTPVIQIIEITEDEKSYYIFYNLETIDLEGGRWSEVTKDKLLTVFKDDLKGRDLGLYAAKQLGGVIDWQLAYLKEVREIEKGKGATQKVVAITYSGLIGKFLNPREKTFPGYDPVIKPRKKESNQAPENISFVRSIETEINSILPEEVTVETTSNTESPQDTPPPHP